MNATQQDDPALGADASRNNDFKFTAGNQDACPFAAHIRKMNPRNDLPEDTIKPHMILRRGIPFGPEVSDDERQSNATTSERGLLFVCYQSALASGFEFLQQCKSLLFRDTTQLTKRLVWANNQNFPPANGATPGFDPLIGQTTSGGPRTMTGAFANNTAQPLNLLTQWVNSKGGEYFFTPSIPTLKNVFATA